MSPIITSKEENNIACVIYGANNMHMESRPILQPQTDELQINIRATGICGSDLHYHYDGRLGARVLDPSLPMVLGHESAGIVTQVGPTSGEQSMFQVGDRVVLEPSKSCGQCHCCQSQRYNICPRMKYSSTVQQGPNDGTLRRSICYPSHLLHKMPDTMTFEEGALIEPLAVAMHATARSPVTQGSSVLIYGAGTIGLLVAASCYAQGATQVAIADINTSRLQFATTYLPGISTITLEKSRSDDDLFVWAQSQAAGKDGDYDVVFECTGVESCVVLSFFMVNSGGSVVLVGLGQTKIALPVDVIATKEVNVIGSYRYANIHRKAIDAVANGKIRLLPLVSHRFKLEDTPLAFETLRKGGDGVLKVQIGDF
ncbi:GroES-like protein [Halteromyces radiatus]|uniref:GroES-like protein n=1 Tax=Halteromyces radiatus TaxID=101107 RepID=UPI00221EB5F9|nr:GroES-like protein [Halteromyces radiatus]KAI8085041.1 GroES-like protein [Halteromyces radiatus]